MFENFKKPVSILLALVMLCGVLAAAPFTVNAVETEYTTSTGGKYTFNTKTGVLNLISGEFTGSSWEITKTNVKKVTVNSYANPPIKFTDDCGGMFSRLENCESIDLSNVDTSEMTSMWSMFSKCYALKYLNISSFNTRQVVWFTTAFWDCGNLETLDLSSFYISRGINLNNIYGIFKGCDKLNTLKISGKFYMGVHQVMLLNTGRAGDEGWIESDSTTGYVSSGNMEYTDNGQIHNSDIGKKYNVATLSIPDQPDQTITYVWIATTANYTFNEKTGELHLISGFFRCSTWQNDFDKTKVISITTAESSVKLTSNCAWMFSGFSNCESIDLSKVDTSNVTNMESMFKDCTKLTDINVSGFDLKNVNSVKKMFSNCTELQTLDLSSVILSSGIIAEKLFPLFDNSNKLSRLTLSSDFYMGGITTSMELNNGDNGKGWYIMGDPSATKVSGDDEDSAHISDINGTQTFIWIDYFGVDWKNWDGTKLRSENYKAETDIHPTYKGTTVPAKPDSDGYSYTFAGWTDGENEYDLNTELPIVTNDVTYTAVFTATPKKFFAAHSLSLNGDIGVNFFIDVTAAGITPQDILSGDSTLTLNFSWNTDPAPVTDISIDNITLSKSNAARYYDEDNGYFKIKCNVAAAEMACGIKAEGIVAGAKDYSESETYSVRDYGMTIVNNASKYPETLVDLAKKMLDYGAKAQAVFNIIPNDLANKDVTDYTMSNVTASDVQAAINAEPANSGKTASDMALGTSDYGLEYEKSTVVYLTKSTLRHYYSISDQGKYDKVKAQFNERKLPYVYIEYSDIAAADLDKLQTFTIGTRTYYYSALDYVKNVLGSKSPDANKKLAMAMYWYNQAANAYFG